MRTNLPSRTFLATGMVALLAACSSAPPPPEAPPAPDMAALTSTVQGMEDAYAKAAAAKDIDGVMTYYADDLVSYGMHREPHMSKAGLRQEMADKMAKDTTGTTPSFKVTELFVGNDHITEIGTWTDTDKAGQVVDNGTYFSVFKKNGDGWLCVREISVSHKPKKEEAAAPAP